MDTVRCKLRCESVKNYGDDGNGNPTQQEVQFRAVAGDKVSKGYPEDGADEDNTFARYTPSADFRMTVCNPALLGFYKPEKRYYVTMTEVPQE